VSYPEWLKGDLAELQRDIMREKLGRVAELLRQEIVNSGMVDTGRLVNSIRIDELNGRVFLKVPYAEELEHGRKKGGRLPPYRVIRAWVGRKFGIRGIKEGHSVTWAIMRSIQKNGLKGRHFIRKAWDRALRE
jgi:hypothetical protein